MFLTPRNSQVDVVQSVGRVMRTTRDGKKKRGYVVLPVVIPAGVEPHEALNDNKTYKVVWQVLQALRSHDDRFDAMVNKLDLIGKDTSKMEVIAITDKVQRKPKKSAGSKNKDAGRGGFTIGEPEPKRYGKDDQQELGFEIGEIEKAIYAKLVQKVGNRNHWEDWANDIARIARTHIDRITALLENSANGKEKEVFNRFAKELRDDLNGSISDDEVVEMLAQHLITKPVFDALFENYSFAQHNPMSLAMQGVLDVLQEHQLAKEADTLQRFYESVKLRAQGIDNAAGKQKIVVELYDKFFANAFPRLRDKLGIVYTPVEVVDFIIHSVAHILQTEFGQTLGSKGVHIIDPFTGTGTFITRLLQSGLIAPEHLPHKYKHEIHANELVLLAYYIAAINIEAVYHGIVGGTYQPFDGICLTDTFQLYEKEDMVDEMLAKNSGRRKKQKALDIRVIIGNPPYSVGQESANDNNQNVTYPLLDTRIRSTYAARSNVSKVRSLYDSYIRAIRWASDRIGESGVIGFVTNAGFIDSTSASGMRKCLAEEFSCIYVFHLRGNARTSGEQRRREKDNVFGVGSRAPVAISILVKNPAAKQRGRIYFYDIGDYLSREEKLSKISELLSIEGVGRADGWQHIQPDQHGDWIKQREGDFSEFIAIGDKNLGEPKIFATFSRGVGTNRDAWCFNSSKRSLVNNIEGMIGFYNQEAERFAREYGMLDKSEREKKIDGFIKMDPTKMSWDARARGELAKLNIHAFEPTCVVQSMYRPFFKQWLYMSKTFNWSHYVMPSIFPTDSANLAIVVKLRWDGNGQFALMTDKVVEQQTDGGTQCFPLYLYDEPTEEAAQSDRSISDMFAAPEVEPTGRRRRDAITVEGLSYFQHAYPSETVCKEDIFYYIYGLFHSADYRERYADNLAKELPRIPRVKTAGDFWAFSQAGRRLADLHVNYESVEPYALMIDSGGKNLTDADYRVEKMRYGKKGKDKDLTTLHYNDRITLSGIPLEAYDYVVNGKPALDWVVERQGVKMDKDSGIVNDANDWAIETMGNPRYPLELLLRVITVSIETMKIVRSLPPLDLSDNGVQVFDGPRH